MRIKKCLYLIFLIVFYTIFVPINIYSFDPSGDGSMGMGCGGCSSGSGNGPSGNGPSGDSESSDNGGREGKDSYTDEEEGYTQDEIDSMAADSEAEEAANKAQETETGFWGSLWEGIKSVVKSVLGAPSAVGKALGLPDWAVDVVTIGAGIVTGGLNVGSVLTSIATNIAGKVASNLLSDTQTEQINEETTTPVEIISNPLDDIANIIAASIRTTDSSAVAIG